ncbi:hypothetical protein VA7868_03662 [Vibrio aerogenes CECT 7868]|uniref:Uncharacterized protein n=1 Tax=Vibrio aerogenes CECT 7868 TaxID=1216006 RepID=A0A1M6ATC6_9VIBR|nr:hypothetical protein VA7868_03662 [Vibrio aerogenes CECT 7868]
MIKKECCRVSKIERCGALLSEPEERQRLIDFLRLHSPFSQSQAALFTIECLTSCSFNGRNLNHNLNLVQMLATLAESAGFIVGGRVVGATPAFCTGIHCRGPLSGVQTRRAEWVTGAEHREIIKEKYQRHFSLRTFICCLLIRTMIDQEKSSKPPPKSSKPPLSKPPKSLLSKPLSPNPLLSKKPELSAKPLSFAKVPLSTP